ncbi:putative phage holin [Streptomyces sp. NPDC002623]
MIEMDSAQLANFYASGLVALCAVIFAIVYQLHAPWRDSAFGRHVMIFTLTVGAVFSYTVVVSIWPDGLVATVMRIARVLLALGIAGLIIQRTRMVLSAQHRDQLTDDTPAHDDSAT